MKLAVLGLLAWALCSAQTSTLKVVSEFTRIDPFGEIVPQDRGKAEPREFLSPGIPRNAFSSLRIVVTLDKPATYVLDIGQNPENAVKATLYKERFQKQLLLRTLSESWFQFSDHVEHSNKVTGGKIALLFRESLARALTDIG